MYYRDSNKGCGTVFVMALVTLVVGIISPQLGMILFFIFLAIILFNVIKAMFHD